MCSQFVLRWTSGSSRWNMSTQTKPTSWGLWRLQATRTHLIWKRISYLSKEASTCPVCPKKQNEQWDKITQHQLFCVSSKRTYWWYIYLFQNPVNLLFWSCSRGGPINAVTIRLVRPRASACKYFFLFSSFVHFCFGHQQWGKGKRECGTVDTKADSWSSE